MEETLPSSFAKYIDKCDATFKDEAFFIESIISVNSQTKEKVSKEVIDYFKKNESNKVDAVNLFLRVITYATTIRLTNLPALYSLLSLVNQSFNLNSFVIENDPDIKTVVCDALLFSSKPDANPCFPFNCSAKTPFHAILTDDVEELRNLKFDAQTTVNFRITKHEVLFPASALTLTDFSALCGSAKCFAFLANTFPVSTSVAPYAVAGGNLEIVDVIFKKGIELSNYLEVSIAFHRFEVFDWLLLKYNYMSIPVSPFYCLQCLNEPIFAFINETAVNPDQKYVSLEMCEASTSIRKIPGIGKYIISEKQKCYPVFKEYIKNYYIDHYSLGTKVWAESEINKLLDSNITSEELKIKLFIMIKGLKINYDAMAKNANREPFANARNLIVVGDQNAIYTSDACNIPSIRSPEDIYFILPKWKDKLTVFNMKDEFGTINGRSFKQRIQKSGLCYIHAPVLYLYYAIRRNNHELSEMINITELIKTTFTNDQICEHIEHDGGGSSAAILMNFASSIQKQNEKKSSIDNKTNEITKESHSDGTNSSDEEDEEDEDSNDDTIKYVPVAPLSVNKKIFREHGPFLLSGFNVYQDFYDPTKFSYTCTDDPTGDCKGLHAMVVVGIRKIKGDYMFLVQNWWPKKQFIEMSGKYITKHNGYFGYIDNVKISNYDEINISSTTFESIVETSVDTQEKLGSERSLM